MNRSNLVLHAKESIQRGSKSFAVASKLFSKTMRERVWLLYAWCRECDDLADGQEDGRRSVLSPASKKSVAAMRMLTRRAHGGEKTGKPAFDGFGVVAQECNIPMNFANDMIDGFALDAQGWQPQNEDDLFQYCYHVAGAVGCMMAVVMGVSKNDSETLDRACDLGLAFQLANIARDVAEDAQAGRCYIPHSWLEESDVLASEITSKSQRDAVTAIIARLCDLSEKYEASAVVGAERLPFRARWAVLSAAGIYGDIARAVRSSDGASLDSRVYTSKSAKSGWVAKAFFKALRKAPYSDREGLWNRPITHSL